MGRARGGRAARLVGGVALALALGACGGDDGGGDGAGGEPNTVVLRNVKFQPDRISVPRGTTVTWRWDDGAVQHDVSGQGFKSEIKTSGTFTHTFADAGTFEYICTVHPTNMKGTVEVS